MSDKFLIKQKLMSQHSSLMTKWSCFAISLCTNKVYITLSSLCRDDNLIVIIQSHFPGKRCFQLYISYSYQQLMFRYFSITLLLNPLDQTIILEIHFHQLIMIQVLFSNDIQCNSSHKCHHHNNVKFVHLRKRICIGCYI